MLLGAVLNPLFHQASAVYAQPCRWRLNLLLVQTRPVGRHRHERKMKGLLNKFRLCIVGCGRVAEHHLRGCLASGTAEVVALVDPVESRARELAQNYGLRPLISPDLNKVLGSVDGAIIAAPNHLHSDLVLTCLRARVPVLVEKPLATSVAEGEAICRASQEQGTIVAVGYVSRFAACIKLMKSLLDQSYFGRIYRFLQQEGTCGGWAPFSAFNLDRKATGGGVLVDVGSHFLDRMLYWFGYPDDARLVYDSLGGPEANAIATFTYRRDGHDFTGVARFSKTARLPSGFIVETENGRVALPDSVDAKIQFSPKQWPQLEMTIEGATNRLLPGKTDVFRLQIEDFVEACVAGRQPTVPASECMASLRLIAQLYAQPTPLPEIWDDTVLPRRNI